MGGSMLPTYSPDFQNFGNGNDSVQLNESNQAFTPGSYIQ